MGPGPRGPKERGPMKPLQQSNRPGSLADMLHSLALRTSQHRHPCWRHDPPSRTGPD